MRHIKWTEIFSFHSPISLQSNIYGNIGDIRDENDATDTDKDQWRDHDIWICAVQCHSKLPDAGD